MKKLLKKILISALAVVLLLSVTQLRSQPGVSAEETYTLFEGTESTSTITPNEYMSVKGLSSYVSVSTNVGGKNYVRSINTGGSSSSSKYIQINCDSAFELYIVAGSNSSSSAVTFSLGTTASNGNSDVIRSKEFTSTFTADTLRVNAGGSYYLNFANCKICEITLTPVVVDTSDSEYMLEKIKHDFSFMKEFFRSDEMHMNFIFNESQKVAFIANPNDDNQSWNGYDYGYVLNEGQSITIKPDGDTEIVSFTIIPFSWLDLSLTDKYKLNYFDGTVYVLNEEHSQNYWFGELMGGLDYFLHFEPLDNYDFYEPLTITSEYFGEPVIILSVKQHIRYNLSLAELIEQKGININEPYAWLHADINTFFPDLSSLRIVNGVLCSPNMVVEEELFYNLSEYMDGYYQGFIDKVSGLEKNANADKSSDYKAGYDEGYNQDDLDFLGDYENPNQKMYDFIKQYCSDENGVYDYVNFDNFEQIRNGLYDWYRFTQSEKDFIDLELTKANETKNQDLLTYEALSGLALKYKRALDFVNDYLLDEEDNVITVGTAENYKQVENAYVIYRNDYNYDIRSLIDEVITKANGSQKSFLDIYQECREALANSVEYTFIRNYLMHDGEIVDSLAFIDVEKVLSSKAEYDTLTDEQKARIDEILLTANGRNSEVNSYAKIYHYAEVSKEVQEYADSYLEFRHVELEPGVTVLRAFFKEGLEKEAIAEFNSKTKEVQDMINAYLYSELQIHFTIGDMEKEYKKQQQEDTEKDDNGKETNKPSDEKADSGSEDKAPSPGSKPGDGEGTTICHHEIDWLKFACKKCGMSVFEIVWNAIKYWLLGIGACIAAFFMIRWAIKLAKG